MKLILRNAYVEIRESDEETKVVIRESDAPPSEANPEYVISAKYPSISYATADDS